MRKYFATLVSAAMMVMWSGCSSEVIEEGPDEHNGVIGFGTTHVAKASKALTNDNFSKFYVYGTYKPSNSTAPVIVFDGTEVYKDGTNWKYTEGGDRYWVPNESYDFYAYSCENTKFSSTDGNILNANLNERVLNLRGVRSDETHQHDLTFAKITNQSRPAHSEGVTPEKVNLQFKHILSRVKFTIKTNFVADGKYKVTISDLKINNFRNVGDFEGAGEGAWNANSVDRYPKETTPSLTLKLAENNSWTVDGYNGTIETEPIYMIPFSYTAANVELSFGIQITDKDGKDILGRNVTARWQPNWQMGTSLNNEITIDGGRVGLDPIVFTGSLVSTGDDGWTDGGNGVLNGLTFDANSN